MKKLLFTVIGAMALSISNVSAQAVEEGNIIIDAYYGFPNLYTTVFKAAYASSGAEQDLKIGGIGPVGLRGEYMVADKIGVGIDIGFNNSFVRYTEERTEFNQTTGNSETVEYDYDLSTKKIGVMATFNYHFLESSDKLDAYFVVGAGYGNRSFSFESTEPNYKGAEAKSLVPVAGKIGVGMRYFFTDNIGANLSVGFGQGGILNAGISAKF